MSENRFDVAILGSGFGGTLLATILQQQGYRVAVIDRGRHPRFAIGESSTPAADLILRDLCDRYRLVSLRPLSRYGSWKEQFPAVRCGRKRGFSYFHHVPGEPFTSDAMNRHQLLVAASSDDWACDMHWYRADTDQLFARFATQKGVVLMEGTEVTSVHSKQGIWSIETLGDEIAGDGTARTLRADFLIDASGEAQLLARQLNIPPAPTELLTHSIACFTHLRGVRSWTARLAERGYSAEHPFNSDDAAQHHLLQEGWLWMLRFDGGVTSVGLCVDRECGERVPEGDQPAVALIQQTIARYPDLAWMMADAELAKVPGHWMSSNRLQRLSSCGAGPGWVALPHSVGFIDPLHSTGIALTMFAIERIAAAMDPTGGGFREELLTEYDHDLRMTFAWIDQLVWVCYRTRSHERLFHAAVMLYFTATIAFEGRRQRGEVGQFLAADWLPLRRVALQFVAKLRDLPVQLRQDHHRQADQLGDQLADQLLADLSPLSDVGLGDPQYRKMYRHTSCDV